MHLHEVSDDQHRRAGHAAEAMHHHGLALGQRRGDGGVDRPEERLGVAHVVEEVQGQHHHVLAVVPRLRRALVVGGARIHHQPHRQLQRGEHERVLDVVELGQVQAGHHGRQLARVRARRARDTRDLAHVGRSTRMEVDEGRVGLVVRVGGGHGLDSVKMQPQ